VHALAILGGVCPVAGPDASEGGLVALSARLNSVLAPLRTPLSGVVSGLIGLIGPLSHPAYSQFAKIMPEGDRRVFADPEIEAMFIRDLVAANRHRHGFRGLFNDVVLFGRPWGFELGEIDVPVRWWHGNADSIVSLGDAEDAVALIPDCELHIRPGESHLGGFAAAHEVLQTLDALWPQ
jgi:pimeloyl-ACP methyl ester carboxylesterase